MKVAVPVFGEEVSPRFGCSTHALVATVDQGGVQIEGMQDLSQVPPWQWPDLFSSLGVAKVVCGGMHGRFQEELERRGIEVIWGVIGPAADALAALQKGTLRSDQFLCRGRRRRRGRGRGGQMGQGPPPWSGGGGPGRGSRRLDGWNSGQEGRGRGGFGRGGQQPPENFERRS
jgi:predicted Fe-Mo cluster-binding NifX family protein